MALMTKYFTVYGGAQLGKGVCVTVGSPACQELNKMDAAIIVFKDFIMSFKQLKVIPLRINKHL